MEDREPWFTLRLKGPGSQATQEELDLVAKAVHHALEVDFREEVELAKAELNEACVEWALWGKPIDIEPILARYEARLRSLE